MTEPYSEIVGTRPGPYDVGGAILRPCPNCGAPEGVRCTVDAGGRLVGRRYRRIPCVARITGRCAS
jgi:hypothetical protein